MMLQNMVVFLKPMDTLKKKFFDKHTDIVIPEDT